MKIGMILAVTIVVWTWSCEDKGSSPPPAGSPPPEEQSGPEPGAEVSKNSSGIGATISGSLVVGDGVPVELPVGAGQDRQDGRTLRSLGIPPGAFAELGFPEV